VKAWTRTPTDWVDDPIVHRMAEVLNLDAVKVVGHLLCIWSKLPEFAADGYLTPITPTLLEQWARWRGKRGAFDHAFRTLVLDPAGWWPLWVELNGAVLSEKENDRKRAAERRRLIKEAKEAQLDAFAASTAAAIAADQSKSPADGPPDGPAPRTNGRTTTTASARARNGNSASASADLVPIRPHLPAVAVAPPWCAECGVGELVPVTWQRRPVQVHLTSCSRFTAPTPPPSAPPFPHVLEATA
jgi:hypothetical protein